MNVTVLKLLDVSLVEMRLECFDVHDVFDLPMSWYRLIHDMQ